MYKTMSIHKFNKSKDNTYLIPTYIRDDGKYTIQSKEHGSTSRKIFVVTDIDGKEVGTFDNLKGAKFFFEVDRM